MSREEDRSEIKILKNKLQEYDAIIADIEAKRSVAIVKAGPFHKDNKIIYRVDSGGGDIIVNLQPSLSHIKKLKPGDEVILLESLIVDVVHKDLKVFKPKSKYSLAKWDEIIGLNSEIEEIQSSIATLKADQGEMAEFGITPIKGALLYGPPGCGKTMIAKAVAAEILETDECEDGEFFYIKGGELLNKYVGESERSIVDIFARSREFTRKTKKRSIVFIDEAEAILGKRKHSSINASVVPTFLSEMDGLEMDNPFVLLSTNLPDSLDEAVIREGRIDLKIQVNRPTVSGVKELMEHYLKNSKCVDDIETLSSKTATEIFTSTLEVRVSGSMISSLVNLSAKRAFTRFLKDKTQAKGIKLEDVQYCMEQMKF